jgi:hypothetical protein
MNVSLEVKQSLLVNDVCENNYSCKMHPHRMPNDGIETESRSLSRNICKGFKNLLTSWPIAADGNSTYLQSSSLH